MPRRCRPAPGIGPGFTQTAAHGNRLRQSEPFKRWSIGSRMRRQLLSGFMPCTRPHSGCRWLERRCLRPWGRTVPTPPRTRTVSVLPSTFVKVSFSHPSAVSRNRTLSESRGTCSRKCPTVQSWRRHRAGTQNDEEPFFALVRRVPHRTHAAAESLVWYFVIGLAGGACCETVCGKQCNRNTESVLAPLWCPPRSTRNRPMLGPRGPRVMLALCLPPQSCLLPPKSL